MAKEKGIGERIAHSITRAFNPAQVIDEALKISVPELLHAAEKMEALSIGMREFAEFARELQELVQHNVGNLREAQEIASDHRYHLANVATIAQNLPVYFERDPETVLNILTAVDVPILAEVARKLPNARRLELIKALDPTGVFD